MNCILQGRSLGRSCRPLISQLLSSTKGTNQLLILCSFSYAANNLTKVITNQQCSVNCKATYCTSLSELQYEKIGDETLESLSEHLEALIEKQNAPDDSDITFSNGVLTFELGSFGTYVINKQTPNKQIWLSSPTTGPKRYDFVDDSWIYKHDGMPLHSLLANELSEIFKEHISFSQCAFAKKNL